MGARESYAQFNAFVRELKLAAITRVLGERGIKDERGDLASTILDSLNVDQLANQAWNNGKRNVTELGVAAFDRWWSGVVEARKAKART